MLQLNPIGDLTGPRIVVELHDLISALFVQRMPWIALVPQVDISVVVVVTKVALQPQSANERSRWFVSIFQVTAITRPSIIPKRDAHAVFTVLRIPP